MNSSHSHLVGGQLSEDGQGNGETLGTRNENGPLIPTQ